MLRRGKFWLLAGMVGALAWAIPAALPRRPAPGPVGPPPGYDLTPSFADEFAGSRIDTARWTTAYADPPPQSATIQQRTLSGNGEREVYVDPGYLGLGLDPFTVRAGILTIRAAPLAPAARAAMLRELDGLPPGQRDDPVTRQVGYSSGLISTRGRFTQLHGYFETRARWSAGKGLWPAFWMLPKGGGWPPEIDIVEAHGDKPAALFHSTHSAEVETATRVAVGDDPQAFHRYGALWLPDRIEYYVDGNRTATLPSPPDMTVPMYLLVNLAVGGYWPGDPGPDVRFPATLEIDYVRAWRFRRLPSTAPR